MWVWTTRLWSAIAKIPRKASIGRKPRKREIAAALLRARRRFDLHFVRLRNLILAIYLGEPWVWPFGQVPAPRIRIHRAHSAVTLPSGYEIVRSASALAAKNPM